jgi:hypothetical protein
MKYALPAVEDYEKILPVSRMLYDHTSRLSWEMLLPLFLVSVAFGYTQDLGLAGSVLTRLKRLFLVALLLATFPMIAEFAQIIGVEIAKSIDDMTGIDVVLEAASKRAAMFSFDLKGILSMGSDLLMGTLVMMSFIILVVARFFLLAFQHFYWFLLVALGPFMILGLLFESSSVITKGLFKNMFQISAWPVIWSTLSAFLKALPFASAYSTEGGLITVVTLNLIIAVALLFSPFIVSQICEGVSLSVGNTLRSGALQAVGAVGGPKGLALAAAAKTTSATSKAARAYTAARDARAFSKTGMKRGSNGGYSDA